MGLKPNHNVLLAFFFSLMVLCVFPITSRPVQVPSMQQRHQQWMLRYGRMYKDSKEKEMRFEIFQENVASIDSFNTAANIKPYKLSVNQFADLTNEEFRASLRTTFKNNNRASLSMAGSFRHEKATAPPPPPAIDWRKKGAVTPIKSAFGCECSWAFSAVAAIEGITKISSGKLLSLSEQELVDCGGGDIFGSVDEGFKFVIQNGGITTETNYPFNGTVGTCNATKAADHAATITGYEDVPTNDEDALKKAVAQQPVSVTIDAGCSSFQFYGGGIFTEDCGDDLNIDVAVVGYGVGANGTKYWLVKNIWGKSWGEEGYIRMQRDVKAKEGLCGIAMVASYPTVYN